MIRELFCSRIFHYLPKSASGEQHIETAAIVDVGLAVEENPVIGAQDVFHGVDNGGLGKGRRVEDFAAEIAGGCYDDESSCASGYSVLDCM